MKVRPDVFLIMRIGLIDCDYTGKFPNIALMKLSAHHKRQGDSVMWYDHFSGEFDRVYVSKVFSFTPDFLEHINAKEVIKGGSGYAIKLIDGREFYDNSKDIDLPSEIEHICPDYDLYNIKDTAYGFLSRGCPRGCEFCHVAKKEGRISRKVADLSEFWRGQKKYVFVTLTYWLVGIGATYCSNWKIVERTLTLIKDLMRGC